jgi:hypothetical protein
LPLLFARLQIQSVPVRTDVQPFGGNQGSGRGGFVLVFGARPEMPTTAACQPVVDSSGEYQPNPRLSELGRALVPP